MGFIKSHMTAWMPVNLELETMGYNVPELYSNKHPFSIELVEAIYVALTKCKEKYPQWYEAMSEQIDKWMLKLGKIINK